MLTIKIYLEIYLKTVSSILLTHVELLKYVEREYGLRRWVKHYCIGSFFFLNKTFSLYFEI